jgi:hypothetical protein
MNIARKGSLDIPHSILGFIDRKIRQRIMSEEIVKLAL